MQNDHELLKTKYCEIKEFMCDIIYIIREEYPYNQIDKIDDENISRIKDILEIIINTSYNIIKLNVKRNIFLEILKVFCLILSVSNDSWYFTGIYNSLNDYANKFNINDVQKYIKYCVLTGFIYRKIENVHELCNYGKKYGLDLEYICFGNHPLQYKIKKSHKRFELKYISYDNNIFDQINNYDDIMQICQDILKKFVNTY